jgi:DNA-binding transcriptional LysR family regulator
MGLAYPLPKTIIASEHEKGQLAVLPLRYPSLVVNVQLLYHVKKHISKPMRAFIQSVTRIHTNN